MNTLKHKLSKWVHEIFCPVRLWSWSNLWATCFWLRIIASGAKAKLKGCTHPAWKTSFGFSLFLSCRLVDSFLLLLLARRNTCHANGGETSKCGKAVKRPAWMVHIMYMLVFVGSRPLLSRARGEDWRGVWRSVPWVEELVDKMKRHSGRDSQLASCKN